MCWPQCSPRHRTRTLCSHLSRLSALRSCVVLCAAILKSVLAPASLCWTRPWCVCVGLSVCMYASMYVYIPPPPPSTNTHTNTHTGGLRQSQAERSGAGGIRGGIRQGGGEQSARLRVSVAADAADYRRWRRECEEVGGGTHSQKCSLQWRSKGSLGSQSTFTGH